MLEAYSVAIKLHLVNNVSTGLAALVQQFEATNAQVTRLQTQLKSIKTQGLVGAALFTTGAVIAAPIVYATTKAAELQKQLIAVQIATRGTVGEMTGMRRSIESIAGQTVFSNIDVAKMAKLVATGTGLGASQVSGLLPAYAKFADVQLLMKGTDYATSTKDAIRLAHTAQHYDPKSLGAYLDLLTKASMIVPGSLSEVGHALKYSQGVGKTALGIDDENMVLLTSLLNRLGFAGSRGGTNLIAAMTRTIPGVFGSGLLKGKSGEALANMGMVDGTGHSKFFRNGKFDAFMWMGGLSEYMQREFARNPEAVARQEIMKNFQHAFGSQGSRVAVLLASPEALKQFQAIGATFAGYGGVDSMQKKFADESVSQQMMNAKTNFTSAMTEIGYTLLPLASRGLTALNHGLQSLIKWISDNPGKVKAMTLALTGLSAALMFGGVVNLAAAGFRGLGLALSVFSVGGKAALLADVSTGFIGISRALIGNAGLVAAAGAAGYAIGGLINKLLGIEHGEFGGAVYDLTHNKYGEFSLQDSITANASRAKWTQVHTNIHIDGQKMATVVTKHQTNAARTAQHGTTWSDSSMLMPVPSHP